MKLLKGFLLFIIYLIIIILFLPSKVDAMMIENWVNTSSVPYSLGSHTILNYNNKLFLIGGSAEFNVNKPKPLSAVINPNHTINSWTEEVQMPKGLIWHTSSINDSFIYVIGGTENTTGSSITNTVYRGILNSNNNIANWIPESVLPKPLALASSYIVGDKLYVSGGFSSSGVNLDIYVATINADGSLSNWTLAGQMHESRYGHSFIEHNGYFYTIGGRDLNGNFYPQIYRQEINANGTLSSSIPQNFLPLGTARNSTLKIGNKIIVMGGESPLGITDKIYFSEILANGNISDWNTSIINLPNTFCCGAAAFVNDYIYYVGGHDGGNYFDTVYFTKVDLSTSPDPTSISLNVPLLKQTVSPWEDDIYDSANTWNPSEPTINRWGCAMTSAVMVMNYHGLKKINNSENLDPGTLNTWLKSQPDGYTKNGRINWLAISRLSKQIKAFNPEFNFDALEYKKIKGMDDDTLSADLMGGNPGILDVSGHFVVAKGKTETTYLINDPFYSRTSLEDGYNNTYYSLGRYIPSNTDLSYILLVYNSGLDVSFETISGNTLGEDFTETPLVDPVTGIANGEIIYSKYILQPESGEYKIAVSSSDTQSYYLDIYLYDINGNVKKHVETGLVDQSNILTFNLSYDKTNVAHSAVSQQPELMDFHTFYNNLKLLHENKSINFVTFTILQVSLKNIENDYNKGKIDHALTKIDLMKKFILTFPKNDSSEEVKNTLLSNLEGLQNFVKR